MVNPVCASFFPYVFQSPQRAQNGKIVKLGCAKVDSWLLILPTLPPVVACIILCEGKCDI